MLTLPRRHAAATPSLAAAFDPRSNALAVIRLGLAGLVALTHATEIGFGRQATIGSTEVGELAVDAFFVLSGFLVCRSLLRLDSTGRYAWHRFLRIAPGFYACLLVSALVVAPLAAVIAGRSPLSVLTGPDSAPSYLLNNAALLMRQFGIAGLPDTAHVPDVIDGSLWTLFYEALCYGLLAVLGLLGVLRRRPRLLAVVAGIWGLTVLDALGTNPLGSQYLLRFTLVFLLGAAGFVLADRIPVHPALAGSAAVVLLAALLLTDHYRALAAPALAYLCLYATVRLPLRRNPSRDLSYGLYIYHWPVLQLLAMLGAAGLGPVPFAVLGVGLALLAALASWTFVEGPALALKDVQVRDLLGRRRGAHA
jgi:peptidoglycan/LPS O-acetylase OafA/YrhL